MSLSSTAVSYTMEALCAITEGLESKTSTFFLDADQRILVVQSWSAFPCTTGYMFVWHCGDRGFSAVITTKTEGTVLDLLGQAMERFACEK